MLWKNDKTFKPLIILIILQMNRNMTSICVHQFQRKLLIVSKKSLIKVSKTYDFLETDLSINNGLGFVHI